MSFFSETGVSDLSETLCRLLLKSNTGYLERKLERLPRVQGSLAFTPGIAKVHFRMVCLNPCLINSVILGP